MRLPLSLRRGALGPKHLLRRVLYKHVPRELLERPKQGFGVPLSSWLRGDLNSLMRDYLSPERIRKADILDPRMVQRAVKNFVDGGPRNDRVDVQKLWYLLAFEMWRERWMKPVERNREEALDARAVCH
jgi:asparagine synthase (glutamine-hydrolysing)